MQTIDRRGFLVTAALAGLGVVGLGAVGAVFARPRLRPGFAAYGGDLPTAASAPTT